MSVSKDKTLLIACDHGTPVPDYVDENVSTMAVMIIQPYPGIVNKMVWRKF